MKEELRRSAKWVRKMYWVKKKEKMFKIISASLICALLFSSLSPSQALAFRSRSGGGKIEKFSLGDFGKSLGMSLGLTFVSAGIGSAWSSASQSVATANQASQSADFFSRMGNTLKTIGYLGTHASPWVKGIASSTSLATVMPNIIDGYNNYMVSIHMSRAVAMMGLKPSTTFLLSSVASCSTIGFLNPSAALGSTMSKTMSNVALPVMLKGATVGALQGLISSAAILAIDGDKIKKGKSPGIGAQIAGMAAGVYGIELGRTLVDPRTYNMVWRQSLPAGKTPEGGNLWREAGGTGSYTEADLMRRAEGYNIEMELDEAGITDVTLSNAKSRFQFQDARAIYNHPQTEYIGKIDGQNIFLIQGKENPFTSVTFSLSDTASNLLENSQVAPDGSLWLGTVQSSNAPVAGRILIGPLVNTFDQWPIIATNAISMAVTNKMKAQWRPLASELINAVGGPLLDTFANVYSLKPSLLTSHNKTIAEKLGYYPALKYYQQYQIFRPAISERVAQAVVESKLPERLGLPDNLAPEQLESALKNMDITCDNIIPDSLELQDYKNEVWGAFKEKVRTALLNKELQTFDPRQAAFDVITNLVNANRFNDTWTKQQWKSGSAVPNVLKVLEGIEGSRFGVFSSEAGKIFRTELPAALLSGGVQIALDNVISDKDPSKAMFASLAGVAATSAIRGMVWAMYNRDRYERDVASEGFNPEVAAHRNLINYSDILMARIKGDLPLPDRNTYRITGREYIEGFTTAEPKALALSEIKILKDSVVSGLGEIGLSAVEDTPDLTLNEWRTRVQKTIDDSRKSAIEQGLKEAGLYEQYQAWATGTLTDENTRQQIDRIKLEVAGKFDAKIEGIAGLQQLERLQNISEKLFVEKSSLGSLIYAPDNTMKIKGVDMIYKVDGRLIKPQDANYGKVKLEEGWTTDNSGNLAPLNRYLYEGKSVQGSFPVVQAPGFVPTVFENLRQGLFEFGWQSLSMGLPLAREGKLGSYAWYNYTQQLQALASGSAQPGGLTTVMARYATNVAQDIMGRNILTTVSNTSLGAALGMAPFVPLSGYKGMPFSVAVVLQTPFGGYEARFLRNWPAARLNMVSNDPSHNIFRTAYLSTTAQREVVLEEEKGKTNNK